MYIKCGSKTRTRYIHVSRLANIIGKEVCSALLGYHAYTGCDTVSAFSGRGKVGPFKILVGNVKFQKAFTELGTNWSLSAELLKCLEEFTCRIYAAKSDIPDVNEMRYQLFRSKNGDVESGQLPPCRDCLKLHAIRANYQTAIWKRSLEVQPNIPSPADCNGWVLDDDAQLQINWMAGSPAPDVVLEFLSCKCKQRCVYPSCTCLTNGLKCTESCFLQSCENIRVDEIVQEQNDNCSDDDISDNEDY